MFSLEGALYLATRWGFETVREFAIKEIDRRFTEREPGYDPFDRLDLADRVDVPGWKRPAYEVICNRTEILTAQEGQRLGVERAIVLCGIREQLVTRKLLSGSGCWTCRNGHACTTHGTLTLKDGLDAAKESLGMV